MPPPPSRSVALRRAFQYHDFRFPQVCHYSGNVVGMLVKFFVFMIFVRCDFRYVTSATAPYWPCRTRLAGAFPAYLGVVLTVKSSMTCSGRCQGDNLDTTFRVVVPKSMGRGLPTKINNFEVSYYNRCCSLCSCGDDAHYRLVRWPLWL